jgi:hypothetical protein
VRSTRIVISRNGMSIAVGAMRRERGKGPDHSEESNYIAIVEG